MPEVNLSPKQESGFTSKDLDRFLAKTNRDGECWIWTASEARGHYGQFYFRGECRRAHHFSFIAFKGEIPAGYEIDHICRVRKCVNPHHLRLATRKQNAENMVVQSRNSSGFRNVSKHTTENGSIRWRVLVGHKMKYVSGGYYLTPEEANVAAIALRNRLYTHNVEA